MKYPDSILFLQETWLFEHEMETTFQEFPNHTFHGSTSDMFFPADDVMLISGPAWHGTAIGWPKSEQRKFTPLPTINERFSCARYINHPISALLLSVYFPTSSKDDEFNEVVSVLSEYIRTTRKNDHEVIIIGADKNCSNKSSKSDPGEPPLGGNKNQAAKRVANLSTPWSQHAQFGQPCWHHFLTLARPLFEVVLQLSPGRLFGAKVTNMFQNDAKK